MGFFDTLKKIAGAAAKEIGEAAKEAAQSAADNNNTAVKPQSSAAGTAKATPADIIASGNTPAKPSAEIKDKTYGTEGEYDMCYRLSGDFIEFNSHCEVIPAYQYEPFSDEDYTDFKDNLPQLGIGPDNDIFDAVEELDKSGVLPAGGYEKCDSEYFAFRGSFDKYGERYYAYAFRTGTAREKEMLFVNYNPDICGTALEKKLKAALDEAALSYKESLSE